MGCEIGGETGGIKVGKLVGNVVGIRPGDVVRNDWEHVWGREVEVTVEKRKTMPGTICQLLKRTFAAPIFRAKKYMENVCNGLDYLSTNYIIIQLVQPPYV